ncbi:hypothetical protein B0H14DRAFT_3896173 [Mycena olivaceomarginata]|nr:hypothetical protein B0H14DRAFT_3896173 [Mycena olivaceomarginata]
MHLAKESRKIYVHKGTGDMPTAGTWIKSHRSSSHLISKFLAINTFPLAHRPVSTASPLFTVTMDDTVYLYYRLYDGHSDIFPPYTVENLTAVILQREGETGARADMYLDRKDAMPAAAATAVDIDNGPSTKMASAIRVVVRPSGTAVAQSTSSESATSTTTAPGTIARVSPSQIKRLFPNPGPPPVGPNTPARFPGITPNSTAVVRGYLQRDYEIHDGFFSVGGGPQPHALPYAHRRNPRLPHRAQSPPRHSRTTWVIGKYFQAYLKFFSEEVLKQNDIGATLEEWLFSSKANFDGKQPQMLNRILAGILHPMLYVGYGIEFAIPGLVAEGLAQAAMFPMAPSRQDHAFSIASRILLDDRFDDIAPTSLDDVLGRFGDAIYGYAAQWTVDGTNAKEVESKVQELCFLNVMLYALGGWNDGSFREAEFTVMHLVTTSLRLSSLMVIITSPTSKSLFLRAYFARSLGYWISRGRRPLNVRSFFSSRSSLSPTVPGPVPTPYASAFPNANSPLAITPNPWMQLIQSALVHPDDHLCKVIRTLAHYGTVYGSVPPGTFKMTELKDSELIDGTLFIRAAGFDDDKDGQGERGREGQHLL